MANKNLQDSEEVEFVLEWEGDETTLNDVQSLLPKAFHGQGEGSEPRQLHWRI